MAIKTTRIDDLEQTEVEADAGTLAFSLEGKSYEIDLSTKNATKLRNTLKPFIEAARPAGREKAVGRRSQATASHAGPSGYSADQIQAIREWARANGHQVADKGRIANDILLAYEQAHQSKSSKSAAPQEPKMEFSNA